ncbi:MAG: hypothetical protein H6581_22940 [Bacteroidia bacterium]|nr:hypothetical protein [Bacteroidia bacterium]
MKLTRKKTSLAILATFIFALALVISNCRPHIPKNNRAPLASCTVSQDAFNSWFEKGQAGFVTPANSLNPDPPLNSDCNFYIWAWRDFLWLTSPHKGGFVFSAPPFFDKVGDTLIQYTGHRHLRVRGGKLGAPGQAGGGDVLMTQDSSLVYYAIHTNDVFACFVKGKISKALAGNDFPTQRNQLDSIVEYARSEGEEIADSNTLAIELKSSWVKASAVSDPGKYLSIEADVPTYVPNGENTLWTWDGTTYHPENLVLVGFHLVGSAKGHPEMIWATFEHVANGPDGTYDFTNTDHKPVTSTFQENIQARTDWVFTRNGSTEGECNKVHMALALNRKNIVAKSNQTISPSTTYRGNPWGSLQDTDPENNTLILSLNDNIQKMLPANDVRKNYFLVGAIWTKDGKFPYENDISPYDTAFFKGSKFLLNMTMETYFQGKSNSMSCFSCHNLSKGQPGVDLSHIYDSIQVVDLPGGFHP